MPPNFIALFAKACNLHLFYPMPSRLVFLKYIGAVDPLLGNDREKSNYITVIAK
jgi:hypothetical protein